MISNIRPSLLVDIVIAMGCNRDQSVKKFLEQNNITLNVYNGYCQLTFPTSKHEQLFILQYSHILY